MRLNLFAVTRRVPVLAMVGLLLVMSAWTAQAATRPQAPPDLLRHYRAASAFGHSYMAGVKLLAPYLQAGADGHSLTLDAPASVLARVEPVALAEIEASVAVLNERLAAGTVKVPVDALVAGIRLVDGVTGQFWN